MEKFSSVNELVNKLKPVNPVYCIRPETIKNSIKVFKDKFPGKILYAVKTNPNEFVLKHIIKNGQSDYRRIVGILQELKRSFSEDTITIDSIDSALSLFSQKCGA